MKYFLISAILCAVSCTGLAQTAADSPATREDVEKYFEAVHSHEMTMKILEAMSKPIHQMAHDQCAKDKEKLPADCEARINKSMDDTFKALPIDEMMQAMVPAYQKHFTKGDMDALITFYSAPTGQKVLQEMPAIMGEAMESMMPIMQRSVEKMNARAQQEVAQMRKGSSTKAPDTPAPQN
ncbi:MAG TPA: DUF2059 domain-containing protein [Candidatus Sulfotelmatobacter sp.]|jgi:hypothetical protein